MFPMPVLMIGTYGEDGTPDVMNAAWGGITLEDEITICIAGRSQSRNGHGLEITVGPSS